MSVKYVVSMFAAMLVGFAISPSFSAEVISCNGFESCPEGSPALEARIAALEALLTDVSRGTDPDTSQDTLTFTGMNVQVVNGVGATGFSNGTGNLIIGYNEPRVLGGDDTCESDPENCNRRGGSHNLIIGQRNNYPAYGGMVVGLHNENGPLASVSGGSYNTASGYASSVSGGYYNTASGDRASVSGGLLNTASGYASSVSGGQSNTASGDRASVSGGFNKNAVVVYCWEGDSTENC